ncbi:MAG: hypothetical protein QHC78_08290 [Pigmentiphaga sp.]|uniref:hypothetical protein n=1 Tax=Pigmentiphaga sp. TaxID=1977564 RepID=UPI0029A842B7|nr:hypothetical protein [Pigmentiphaga sp.]MDX3905673.1 hypothetical protein [Pigmentiphaga sp.]
MPASRSSLTLLLPGLLTEAAIAPELARQLAGEPATRILHAWLGAAAPAEQSFDPFVAGCTAREFWWLHRAGYRPPDGKYGRGIAPLLVRSPEPDQPVWLADLAHIQIGRDGPVLTDPGGLGATQAESDALLAAARSTLASHSASAEAVGPGRWKLNVPAGIAQHTGTPEAVTGAALESWWPRTADARPWRKLVNEIQMAWHEAPVNQAREARGEPPINALWLYGGARPWQPAWPDGRPARLAAGAQWLHNLAERDGLGWTSAAAAKADALPGALVELPDLSLPERTDDWRAWLDAAARLERDWFRPVDEALQKGQLRQLTLVLPGRERLVTLHIERRPALLRWLPRTRHDWKRWWLPRES